MNYEVGAGQHINDACVKALAMANENKETVTFTFNDTEVTANPGDSWEEIQQRWQTATDAAREAWLNSPEYKERQAKEAEAYREKCAASMTEPAATEADMRAAKVPHPQTKEQLVEYVESLVNRQHDYGTCVYAMSMAAEAAFNYVSHKLGVTGFQASCADLDFLRRTRSLDGPFMLIKGQDALFPQYDLRKKLDEALKSWGPWLKEEAGKNLAESPDAHPNVLAYWKYLSKMDVESTT